MADIIRADYEALEKVAAGFGQHSDAVEQMLQTVIRSMSKLQDGGWIGRGAEAFFKEMESETLPAVRRLVDALAQASQATSQIGDIFRSAEEEASSPFRNGAAAGSRMGALGGAAAGVGFGAGIGAAAGTGSPLGGAGYGNTLGNNFFGGNMWGSDTYGYTPGGEDWGIPRDWLSGVSGSLQNYTSNSYDDWGIPRDWLSGVEEAFSGPAAGSTGAQPESAAAGGAGETGGGSGGGGGGDSGGGGGSGTGGGSGGMGETTPREPSQPIGTGQASSSRPETHIRDPYSGGRSFARGFSSGGGTDAAEGSSPQAGRLRYQALSGVASGGVGASSASRPSSRMAASVGSGGAAQTGAGGQSSLGLSLGIAAASPFVALLGKAIKSKSEDR